MRIGIFTDTYLPDINGVATASHILRNELVKHGHEVLIVTTEIKGGTTYEDDPNVIRLSGIEMKWLYDYRLANFYSAKAMKMIRQANLDLIHVQTEFSVGIFGKIAAQILNIPVVYTYHTQYEDYVHYLPVFGKMESTEPFLKKIVEKVSRIYGDNCTELIAPSQKTKDILIRYGIENNIHVVPTGLELDKFNPKYDDPQLLAQIKAECGIQEDQFVMIFLGRIAKEKSVDVIISSLPILKAKGINVRLLVVGGGPGLDELKQQAIDENVNDMVYFAGPKTAEYVPYYYHISDVFASASITETQGLTFIEAMASGIPVLARHDKNLEGVIKDQFNGYFFKDSEDLAAIVEKMVSESIDELKKNAFEDAKQYSSEVFYQKMIEVYKKAIIHKHYSYRVSSITQKANNMYTVVLKSDNMDLSLNLPELVILQHGLEKGKLIERDEFEDLKDYEFVSKGYQKALRLLTNKDYTRKQMKEKLERSEEYDDLHIDMILQHLENKHLIDDEAYANDYINRSRKMGLGVRKALVKLRERGISQEILEKIRNNYSRDIEVENATETVRKIYKQNKTRTKSALIRNIRDRLFFNGFECDVIDQAIENVNIERNHDFEKNLLVKELDKAYKKYEKKYDDYERDKHIIASLMRKGFEYDAIKESMQERGQNIDSDD